MRNHKAPLRSPAHRAGKSVDAGEVPLASRGRRLPVLRPERQRGLCGGTACAALVRGIGHHDQTGPHPCWRIPCIARSSMGGASWPARDDGGPTKADAKPSSSPAVVQIRRDTTRFGDRMAASASSSRRSIRFAKRKIERITVFSPPCSSPPSVATRPRVAARSPSSGASWRATETGESTDERARPGSRRSARALRSGTLASSHEL
jgi:hypothetical protein